MFECHGGDHQIRKWRRLATASQSEGQLARPKPCLLVRIQPSSSTEIRQSLLEVSLGGRSLQQFGKHRSGGRYVVARHQLQEFSCFGRILPFVGLYPHGCVD